MNSTPTPPPDDPGRDAWLTAALRHAPDAEAVPPAALSAAILQRARHAAAPASPARPRVLEHLMAAWAWLARPPVAAAFASVMVATVAGLMWWDRPLQEALPPREGPVVSTPVPASEAASKPAPAPAPERSTAAAPAPRAPAVERAPRPAPAAPRQDAARKASSEVAQANDAAKAADAAEAARPAPEARREQAEESPRDTAAPAPAAPPAAAAPAMRARQSLGTSSLESRAVSSMPPTTPSALLAALRAHPQRWSWQHGAADAQALTPALLQWLVDVDNAVGAGWRAVPAGPASATPTLQLARDARLQASLHLDADRVRLTFGNTAYEGALNADTRQRLQATLPPMTR